jgi:hypothetical protein
MRHPCQLFVLSCLLLLVTLAVAHEESKDPCSTYQQCSDKGARALEAGKFDDAISLFKLQAILAEVADVDHIQENTIAGKKRSYPLRVLAYNNLAAAYMNKGNYLVARLWCHVALHWDKKDRAARSYLRQVEGKLGQWKWPKSFQGAYLLYAGGGEWEILSVREKDRGEYSISFFGVWMGPNPKYGPKGIGEFKANLSLDGHMAIYRGDADYPCMVSMVFSSDKVTLKQDGNCGFGHNVKAAGVFERANTTGELPDGGFPVGNGSE